MRCVALGISGVKGPLGLSINTHNNSFTPKAQI